MISNWLNYVLLVLITTNISCIRETEISSRKILSQSVTNPYYKSIYQNRIKTVWIKHFEINPITGHKVNGPIDKWEFDKEGQMISTSSLWKKQTYAYDDLGYIEYIQDYICMETDNWLNTIYNFEMYEGIENTQMLNDGDQVFIIDQNGRPIKKVNKEGYIEYEYDNKNQLTKKIESNSYDCFYLNKLYWKKDLRPPFKIRTEYIYSSYGKLERAVEYIQNDKVAEYFVGSLGIPDSVRIYPSIKYPYYYARELEEYAYETY